MNLQELPMEACGGRALWRVPRLAPMEPDHEQETDQACSVLRGRPERRRRTSRLRAHCAARAEWVCMQSGLVQSRNEPWVRQVRCCHGRDQYRAILSRNPGWAILAV